MDIRKLTEITLFEYAATEEEGDSVDFLLWRESGLRCVGSGILPFSREDHGNFSYEHLPFTRARDILLIKEGVK